LCRLPKRHLAQEVVQNYFSQRHALCQQPERINQMLRKLLLVVLSVCLSVAFSGVASAQGGAGATARGTGGAVASVDERATQIGIDVLKAGGNAVDAAVAVMAALGFIEPYSCGIGGGGFMVIYWKKTGEVITIDGRETAPLSASVDMFKDPDNPGNNLPFAPNRISNGAAVGVPGTVALWARARALWNEISG
jgi:gamma-glutamyltranspeptidase/glutathione hydrolase